MSKSHHNLAAIYKDIMAIEIKATDSFKSSLNKFYAVMRKWNVKQGIWDENGHRTCATPEWNMCYDTFKSHKLLSLDIWLLLSEPPPDLMGYGTPPKHILKKIKEKK